MKPSYFERGIKIAEPEKSDTDPLTELGDFVFMGEDGMAEFVTDKLTEEYSLRIPECTKRRVDRLSKVQRKTMNEQLLVTIAQYLHQESFDPRRYLSEDYDTRSANAR